MRLRLDYGTICDAIDEYVERHHPTMKVTDDSSDWAWDIQAVPDKPDDQFPQYVEMGVEETPRAEVGECKQA